MSNADITKKLEQLENILQAEQSKADKGFKITIAIYGILVLFVIFYTGYITRELQESATPKVLATYMSDYAEQQLPQMKTYLKDNIKTEAPAWAEKAVDVSIEAIPNLEDMAKQQIDVLVDKLINKFKNDHFPEIVKFCHENMDATFKNADIVTDENLSKSIANVLVEHIEKHIDSTVNEKFYLKLDELRAEVDKVLSKPHKELTRKEMAEKRVLIYWTYLVNHAEIGESRFMDAVKFFSLFLKAFDDLHLDLDKAKGETL